MYIFSCCVDFRTSADIMDNLDFKQLQGPKPEDAYNFYDAVDM